MNNVAKLFGFTLLRNGVKYDYPFAESIRGLSDLCERVYLALGNSEDSTEAALAPFKNLKIISTVWDENLRKSGLVLSVQTNIALEALRAEQKTGWAVYLQADEVFNPEDFDQIKKDIAMAEAEGCDAVSFRYLHFWLRYDHVAVSPKWYPQEIRAIRIVSEAESYGDAQSFRPIKKAFESDVFVYHYGHVRRPDAYALKKSDFHRWWHADSELGKVLKKGARREKREKVVSFLGPHPSYMKARIASHLELTGENPRIQAQGSKILVLGDPSRFSQAFLDEIPAGVRWTQRPFDLFSVNPKAAIVLEKLPFGFQLLSLGRYRSSVPPKLGSKQARLWTPEFQARLRFAEKGVILSRPGPKT